MATMAKQAQQVEMKPTKPQPEEYAFTMRRSGGGWRIITRIVRGESVIAEEESEPDIRAAQLGRLIKIMRTM